MSTGHVEFHPNPTPHFVMDETSWERLKANLSEGPSIPGVHGSWSGDPVYIDRCPCVDPEGAQQ